MGLPSYQLTTNFSTNCQLTTNSSLTFNFHFTVKILHHNQNLLYLSAPISSGDQTYTETQV